MRSETEVRKFKEKIDKLTGDRLRKLLLLEKERRGIDRSQLTFVGMHNIAQYWWCAMQSVLKSIQNEPEFFGAYLQDRLVYSYLLGYIDTLPSKQEEWLNIGSPITLKDIEKLLKNREKEAVERAGRGIKVRLDAITTIDKYGKPITVINPELSPEEREYYKDREQAKGAMVVADSPIAPPLVRGEFMEYAKAERYISIRWSFAWHDYIVGGVPDGITDDFVYEFKSTKSRFLCDYFTKPVALAQADLYGYFFRRRHKRVQIYVMEEGTTQTWDEPVSEERALETLGKFEKINKGALARPPKAWKCKSCEFIPSCPVYATNR